MYQGKPTGVASQHDKIPWAIFRQEPYASTSPSITTGPTPFSLKPYEKRPALRLLDIVTTEEQPSARPTRQPSRAIPSSSQAKPGGLPFSLLKDLQSGRLNQLLAQVVKINDFDYEKCLLYVTDYTANESFINYQDEEEQSGAEGDSFGYITRKKRNWPGPWGQFTLQVTLWEPHAGFAREHVKAGDLVLITYARIKVGRGDCLEAAIHEDRRYPEKIHIRVVPSDYDDRSRKLMDRRKAYWKVHGKPREESRDGKPKNTEQKKTESRKEEGQTTLPAPIARVKTNRNGRSCSCFHWIFDRNSDIS